MNEANLFGERWQSAKNGSNGDGGDNVRWCWNWSNIRAISNKKTRFKIKNREKQSEKMHQQEWESLHAMVGGESVCETVKRINNRYNLSVKSCRE